MKRLNIPMILFCLGCASLHAEDYYVSLMRKGDGAFKFFVMQGSETGFVEGVFEKKGQKPWLFPEPKMNVTISGSLHHFFKSYGIVTFAINDFYVKIESDRSVFLWGADSNDRIYLFTNTKFREGFRLDFKNVKAPVYCRTKSGNYKWVETDEYNGRSTENNTKHYGSAKQVNEKK